MNDNNPVKQAEEIFRYVINNLDPEILVKNKVNVHHSTLSVVGKEYNLSDYKHIYVAGAGKASAPMAGAVEDLLGNRLDGGIIITKYGHGMPLKKISVVEASHPIPDANGIRGTSDILKLLSNTAKDDLIICLISGGGSALLIHLRKEITLQDLQSVSDALLACGASINEINIVRKHLSLVKGGRLAKAAYPSALLTLLLSDVIGDPLDVIASGPTVPDESTFTDACGVIRKYSLENRIPENVHKFLKRGEAGEVEENPKKGDRIFGNTHNAIIGSNKIALEAAQTKASELGYNTLILSTPIEGESRDAAKNFAAIAKDIYRSGAPIAKPACVIAGGETTVTIKGNGKGGRNQEFALAAAMEIEGSDGITILSAGTDGTDGPTDVAGAIIDNNTCNDARAKYGMLPQEYLDKNDSYHFFKKTGQHLTTGPTRTNVMDIMIALII